MPKIDKASKSALPKSNRLPLRDLASDLEKVKFQLAEAQRSLDNLWVALYSRGLSERGPIVETNKDIPF